MDQLDKQIIDLLQENSRLTNKEIGEKVHLTGQAVGNRINQLIDRKLIKNFTISIAHENTQYIRLFMNKPDFAAIERAVNTFEEVETFDKVSGQACYVVIAHFTSDRLKAFIEVISQWARYSVDTFLSDRKAEPL